MAGKSAALRPVQLLAPFRERSYRYLMQALDARGNRAEALQAYEQLRALLRDELGASPRSSTATCSTDTNASDALKTVPAGADGSVMTRAAVVACCLAAIATPAWGADVHQSWAESQIALVTSRGLFPGTPATFRPDDPLTAGALSALVAALTNRPARVPADPGRAVSIAGLDAALVNAVGLRGLARRFATGARDAGLSPPAWFGTEVVARLLGLRADPTVDGSSPEPQPRQPATRADAAFSAARLLELGQPPAGAPAAAASSSPAAAAGAGAGVQYVTEVADAFSLPELTTWQQRTLQTAVSLIGYPYVRGGDGETGAPGFDCSGLVWRVYKLASYPDAPGLPGTIRGRTAAQMAAEVPRKERIHARELQPGDVLFFGRGPGSRPAQIDHTALYLGNGWLIQASDEGVSLGLLNWYGKRFAWARRPLAEAGLEASPQAAPAAPAA